MTEPYPDWDMGLRRGVKWGLIIATLLTLPNLFIPQGDPAPGVEIADIVRRQLATPSFWFEELGLFAVFFAVVFVIATLIGAFRPS